MDYSGTDFAALVDEVEDQGGTHLDDLCEVIVHKIPEKPGGKVRKIKGTGCQDATIFKLPYKAGIFAGEPDSDQLVECGTMDDGTTAKMAVAVDEGIHLFRACANDDDIGKWPRFAAALNDEWEID